MFTFSSLVFGEELSKEVVEEFNSQNKHKRQIEVLGLQYLNEVSLSKVVLDQKDLEQRKHAYFC
jgi:hypothetical protein